VYANRKILVRRIPPLCNTGPSRILPNSTFLPGPYSLRFQPKLPDFPHFPLILFFFFAPLHLRAFAFKPSAARHRVNHVNPVKKTSSTIRVETLSSFPSFRSVQLVPRDHSDLTDYHHATVPSVPDNFLFSPPRPCASVVKSPPSFAPSRLRAFAFRSEPVQNSVRPR
jgi:hypothetical protein